jgi:hypothetical protein
MPARCEPCPGKVKTNTNATAPIDVCLEEPTVWHAGRAPDPIAAALRTHGAKRRGFNQVVAGYSSETRWDRWCDGVTGAASRRVDGAGNPGAAVRAYALAAGASAVTQPWSTWSPEGFGVGAGVPAVPEPGAAGVVVVVVDDGAVVVVVLWGTVVVVATGLSVVVVVVDDVVVVVGAGAVVVVVGDVDCPEVDGGVAVDGGVGVDGGAAPLGAAVGVGVVIIAAVQAPAFWRVVTSATRRTSERFSSPVSETSVKESCCSVFATPSRCAIATFSAAAAACSRANRSDATTVAYWWATTPSWLGVPKGPVLGPLTRELLW